MTIVNGGRKASPRTRGLSLRRTRTGRAVSGRGLGRCGTRIRWRGGGPENREKRAGRMAALRLGRAGHPHHRRCLGPGPVHHPDQPKRGPHGRADLAGRRGPAAAGSRPRPDPAESGAKAGSARIRAPRRRERSRPRRGPPGRVRPRTKRPPARPWPTSALAASPRPPGRCAGDPWPRRRRTGRMPSSRPCPSPWSDSR